MKDLKYVIMSHLRRIGYRNVTRKAAFEQAHVSRGKYNCASCRNSFRRNELHGDHIEPVIDPVCGFVDWNTYITRLFYNQIQALCITCHKAKTKKENAIRWEEVE